MLYNVLFILTNFQPFCNNKRKGASHFNISLSWLCWPRDAMFFSPQQLSIIFVYNGAVAAENISTSELKWLAPFSFTMEFLKKSL